MWSPGASVVAPHLRCAEEYETALTVDPSSSPQQSSSIGYPSCLHLRKRDDVTYGYKTATPLSSLFLSLPTGFPLCPPLAVPPPQQVPVWGERSLLNVLFHEEHVTALPEIYRLSQLPSVRAPKQVPIGCGSGGRAPRVNCCQHRGDAAGWALPLSRQLFPKSKCLVISWNLRELSLWSEGVCVVPSCLVPCT